MRLLPLIIALPLLASCSVKADSDKKTASVSIGDSILPGDSSLSDKGLKIDADGFKAALEIPGMEIGGKKFDLDGMKLYPGSSVKGMTVQARAKDGEKKGTVRVTFTSPASPDSVLAFAEKEAAREGYAVGRSGLGLTGSDGKDKLIAYIVAAEGSGTRGSVTLSDKNG